MERGHLASDEPWGSTLTAEALAIATSTSTERIDSLAAAGILTPDADGRFTAGDMHVIRLVGAFEANGVSLDALRAARAGGRLDFGTYHELHPEPGEASPRPFEAFAAEVDPDGTKLPELYGALGLAPPQQGAHLSASEEVILARLLERLDDVADRPLAVRAVRLFAEAARRTTEATLDVYQEAAARLGPDPASVDGVAYMELLRPWARLAQDLPAIAGWLTERHLRRAIDAFSVDSTEQILAAHGYVAPRAVSPPGIAFVDLTDYTRRTGAHGDEAAAEMSLRLGEVARPVVARHRGRLVKLLGDGALLWFPGGVSAVAASFELMDALDEVDESGGHTGVHAGPLIEREGDVFGMTVNIAARLSDEAPDGELYVLGSMVESLTAAGYRCERVRAAELHGVGTVDLFRVER
jgi:adenylate cyclase